MNFPAETPPSQRWQALAGDKLVELDKLLEEIQARKTLLTRTLQCQCPILDDCGAGKDCAKIRVVSDFSHNQNRFDLAVQANDATFVLLSI